jgi:hypothetical protein
MLDIVLACFGRVSPLAVVEEEDCPGPGEAMKQSLQEKSFRAASGTPYRTDASDSAPMAFLFASHAMETKSYGRSRSRRIPQDQSTAFHGEVSGAGSPSATSPPLRSRAF